MFSTVHLSLPSLELFKLPPNQNPIPVQPPVPGLTTSAPPFQISPELYHAALEIRVPVTIACVYAALAIALNKYNKSTGNRPWAISQTRVFFAFVVLHNILLAVYSGWTFIGMFVALQNTLKGWSSSQGGFAATVDSLCKLHGASGLGKAVIYDASSSQWISQSPSNVFLTAAGEPNPADLGRLWAEGLAFYGWIFYLSKFYEVLDTLIILAKGKKSSTLQTYHHAGAMMCMWAGIRFMSPPIWMFVFVNSFIHTLMYTYYTLTAFSIPIPQALKRSLTTLQIVQFLVGSSYAAIHSFVSYTVPVQVPFVETIVTSTAPMVETAATTTAATVAAFASAVGFGDLVKKYLFRAAGEEGLAANVGAKVVTEQLVSTVTNHRTEYQTIPCIDTTGQTFAIWLNVFYLAPLTVLFVRFFIRSYIKRTSIAGKKGLPKRKMDVVEKVGANGHANGRANGHANGHA